MNGVKKVLNYVFIDGLSGMSLGLFGTLILGTILKQLSFLIGGECGDWLYTIGMIAMSMMCAGIGVGVAAKYKASVLVTVSAAIVGMIGGYASKILDMNYAPSSAISFADMGVGEPLGAFIGVLVGVTVGKLVSGKTKLDLLVTPIITIGAGSIAGLSVGPAISEFMTTLGGFVNWGTEQQPFLMGIVVSVLMGIFLTLPISSAAIGIILDLSGLAAGAATVGCCCHMVGFAVASYKENKFSGLIAQGLGTSMLQIPNIVKRPLICLPAVISSAILGPLSTMVFHMQNTAAGSGMGTAGAVGILTSYEVMSTLELGNIVGIKIALMYIFFPGLLAFGISAAMRKYKWIKPGEMKLQL